jgi:hypothetical protein
MVTCPDCRGARESSGVACGAGGCRPVTLRCRFCEGAGVVDEARAAWWRVMGKEGAGNVRRGESQRERAAIMGIPEETLNDIEHGRLEYRCARCAGRRTADSIVCEWCLGMTPAVQQ